MKRVGGLIAAVLLVAGWSLHQQFSTADLPRLTEAEARAHLDRIVAASLRHDLKGLCALNGAVLNCRSALADVGPDSVPTRPPRVVSARYVEKQSEGDTAGYLLGVTGTDGRGRHYDSEVYVFRTDRRHLKAINAVYWAGYRVGILTGDGPYESSPVLSTAAAG